MDQSNTKSTPIVLAAGGVVRRRTLRGWKIAVVHRKRYDDWSLPKGKLEPDETPDKGALREIREETGCEGTIVGFAGTTRYTVGDSQKFVFYWNVEVGDVVSFKPPTEVDQLEWLSCREAIARLTYEREKTLLIQARPNWKPAVACPSLRHHRRSRHHRRLCNALQATRVELDHLLERDEGNKGCSSRVDSAFEFLNLAERALRINDINGGWEHLHKARRELLFGLSPAELRAALAVQRREAADKLGSWRSKAYGDLVPDEKDTPPSVTNVVEAQQLIDEYADNRWLKIWTLRSQLQIIGTVVLAAVVGILALSASSQPLLKQVPDDGAWQFLLGVALFGVLGASFSAALSVANERAGGRIPDQVISNWITLMRLVLGAGAAIVVYSLLQAKMLPIVAVSNASGFLGVSFVAGFGERLVVSAVETVSGKQRKRDETNVSGKS
jgi:8-oxo-dGTP pyrophosphatase MutT (NUDIX family)